MKVGYIDVLSDKNLFAQALMEEEIKKGYPEENRDSLWFTMNFTVVN